MMTWRKKTENACIVELDPQTYSGKLRIATGLACLAGMEMVNARLAEVNLPFKVFHGTGDRATNFRYALSGAHWVLMLIVRI